MTANPDIFLIALALLCVLALWGLVRKFRRRFPIVFKARVLYVCDGDTVHVRRNFSRVKVRIAGIDAPETEQPCGEESREHLKDLIEGRQVEVRLLDIDIYGRYVSQVRCEGRDVGLAMLQAGFAWPYFRFMRRMRKEDRAKYRAAADKARGAGRGLWKDRKPTAPWEWRRRHRSLLERILLWLRLLLRRLSGRSMY